MRIWTPLLALPLAMVPLAACRPGNHSSMHEDYNPNLDLLARPPKDCPPYFNCMLPAFTCGQFAECNKYNGQCNCPSGWTGVDCLTPQCDSLADGKKRLPREDKGTCDCKDGWGGINCNVCQTDNACVGFPLAGGISSDDPDLDVGNMTCYKGGETVFSNHQMCDVTNLKIVEMLSDRPPQVTFSCDSLDKTCAFQFWAGQVESFYCGLDECESKTTPGYDTNTTTYDCAMIRCSCVPGRFICGENGSFDISDFLKEEIRGPATFSCKSKEGCTFKEPSMNVLIDQMFGDPYITLECHGGECLHHSQVPGYVTPPKPDNRLWVALSAAGSCSTVLLAVLVLWYAGRTRQGSDYGQIHLPEDEAARLQMDHVPASLFFSDVSYTLGERCILDSISGCVKPGHVMAIMGASGAGKSTLLDILARKAKRGVVGGTTTVNGREVGNAEFKEVVGFVDQEDTLMGTLTVYETVLYSTLLRLPREMSFEAKKYRTLETLSELGILEIKDMRIGESGRRSISGGEKRRVSIACELVTSPSILFLDEPTSGLDAYNAFNVVESLVNLARTHRRTVVFTIHQPRSNIVALFDDLILLAKGKCVYSGEFAKCQGYFESIGQPCPPGFNIADYLIDTTMHAIVDQSSGASSASSSSVTLPEANYGSATNGNEHDVERASRSNAPHSVPISVRSSHSANLDDIDALPASMNNANNQESSTSSSNSYIKSFRSGKLEADTPIAPALNHLVNAYEKSEIAAQILKEAEDLRREAERSDSGLTTGGAVNGNENENVNHALPDVALETSMLRGRKRATWSTQFRILSGRAFKNLYRDPALLTAHYTSAILLAVICGLFVHNVTNDIAGFQNRLGIFFFSLALFGFSCLSSLSLFANERILFMRERSNGYYSSFTYFASKILFDILPLRLVPPLIFGGIVYGLVGFVPAVATFWKFLLVLVLFNLTTASVVLWLSIAFADVGVASLIGTLIMLFNLLFTGLLINRNSMSMAFQWLHTISFFHAAFEALAVNELRYLQLKEMKYGVEIDLPAAAILSTFGLRAQSYWWPNISLLGIFFITFTTASYITLHYFVREKR